MNKSAHSVTVNLNGAQTKERRRRVWIPICTSLTQFARLVPPPSEHDDSREDQKDMDQRRTRTAKTTCPKDMHNWVRSVPPQDPAHCRCPYILPRKQIRMSGTTMSEKSNDKTSMTDLNSPTSSRKRRAVRTGHFGFSPTGDRRSSLEK